MMRHWWAPAAIVLAGLGSGALLAGRVVPPLTGFVIFALAAAAGLVLGFGLGGLGLYRLARGRTEARRTLATAAGPLAIGLAVLTSLLSTPGATYNDVTTDLDDPPVFLAGPATGAPYPDAWRAWHRQTYAELSSARLPASVDATFGKAKALVEVNGWTVATEDRGKGLIQALAQTSIFRFEDDVLIRVRADGAGSVVDLRSRSRVGRGDRGVNAKRIRDYLAALNRP